MSIENSIFKWNPWIAEGKVAKELIGIEREKLEFLMDLLGVRHIKDVVGIRRCGKTTILYQIINRLIEKGEDPKRIIYINFEDPAIYNTRFEELLSIIKQISPQVSILLLDEVQEKKNWERWVKTIYDLRKFKQIIVTGSSASLLKTDFSRLLTGRHITVSLFPLSFREFLIFHGWKSFDNSYLRAHLDELIHYLRIYMKYGGFPEIQKLNEKLKIKVLNDLFDDILSRDVCARYNTDFSITKNLAYYIISNIAKPLSYRNIASAINASVDTVSKYISYLIDAFLIIPVRKFSFKLKEQIREIKKYYCIDLGLINTVGYSFSANIGWIMENLVFLELKKRHFDDKTVEIFYYKVNNREIDFVIKSGTSIETLIQTSYDITPKKVKRREVSALIKGMDELNLKKSIVITWNYENIEVHDDKEIRFIPLWRFLLEESVV